jgi:hypothetical protein
MFKKIRSVAKISQVPRADVEGGGQHAAGYRRPTRPNAKSKVGGARALSGASS